MIDGLHCPACGTSEPAVAGSLEQQDGRFSCRQCGSTYPGFLLDGYVVPWLFPVPMDSFRGWACRYQCAVTRCQRQEASIQSLAACGGMSAAARIRLARMARGAQEKQAGLKDLLNPFAFDAIPALPAAAQQPSLLVYAANVHRDWAWQNDEPRLMRDGVLATLKEAGVQAPRRLLTLGAGTGRLSYDLHAALALEQSLLLEQNPLLLALAARVIGGGTLDWPEVPVAPRDLESACVYRTLTLPEACPARPEALAFILGDARTPPIQAGYFDAVLTPWLIDVIDLSLPTFLDRLNDLLPIGGLWLNTGSLAFEAGDERFAYSIEEVLATIEHAGFQLLSVRREEQPYLQSPASCHQRRELVTSFCAIKRRARITRHPATLAGNAEGRDGRMDLPLERATSYDALAAHHLLHTQVLSAIDGHRTMAELIELLRRQYTLSQQEAQQLIERVLAEAARG